MKSRHPIRRSTLLTVAAALAALTTACSGGTAVQAQPTAAPGDAATTRPPATVTTSAPTVTTVTSPPASQAPPTVATASVPPSTTTTVPPPIPPRYQVDSGEVHAAAKQLGADLAALLTTYEAGTSPADVAAAVTSDQQLRPGLEVAMAPLIKDGRWSRGTVIYPQLGGMTERASSIMVVVRQEIGSGASVEQEETRTLDIRLVKEEGDWHFAELASAGGIAEPRPADLPPAAAAVLDDPRIELPDSARWDIHRGHTSTELLELMSELAERAPYGVVVLASGHPHNVFATDRTSNHTVGRAVDVYRLDDRNVIDDRSDDSLSHETLLWLYDHSSVYKIGGPWALDGSGGRSFTNIVHQDHIHIAVKG